MQWGVLWQPGRGQNHPIENSTGKRTRSRTSSPSASNGEQATPPLPSATALTQACATRKTTAVAPTSSKLSDVEDGSTSVGYCGGGIEGFRG